MQTREQLILTPSKIEELTTSVEQAVDSFLYSETIYFVDEIINDGGE